MSKVLSIDDADDEKHDTTELETKAAEDNQEGEVATKCKAKTGGRGKGSGKRQASQTVPLAKRRKGSVGAKSGDVDVFSGTDAD